MSWQLSQYALPNSYMQQPYALPAMYPRPQEPAYASMIRGAPATYYSFKGRDLGPMKDIASQIGNLAAAQYDETNPLYQRVYEGERGASMQDLAAAISEMSRQNRKLSALGRTPLFNPERGGEQVFRQMTRGYQDAQNNARARARSILGVGQNALASTYNAYGNLADSQLQNNAMKASGFGSIADMLPSILKMFGK